MAKLGPTKIYGDLKVTSNLIVGADNPSLSAALEINSTTQGFVPPRMTAAQRNAIVNPIIGLMVFVTDDQQYYRYTSTGWQSSLGPSGSSGVSGTSGTSGTSGSTGSSGSSGSSGASGTSGTSGTSGSTPNLASPPAIGNTTPNYGRFSRLYVTSRHAIGNQSGTLTINWATNGNKQTATLTGNITSVSMTAPASTEVVSGLTIVLISTNMSITGWPATVKWASGVSPSLTQGVTNAIDIISFYWDGTNYYGTFSNNFS